ncbi:hypothetical protein HK104_002249 [Borealophlyctis nickersoniae]|nr:hypothetical protein HK104_002249 [Borealophlyctis nickersoniae]
MFLLKSLGGLVFGKADADLVQLKNGQLFRLDASNPKGVRELVFKDAVATIRRTTTPFNYMLVITRVYEEGEEELGANEDPDDLLDDERDERSFLIDEVLLFRRVGGRSGPHSIAWADAEDASGSVGSVRGWEFAVDPSTNETTVRMFEETVYGCMFERKFGKSQDGSSDEEQTRFLERVKAAAAARPIGFKAETKFSTPKKQQTLDAGFKTPPSGGARRNTETQKQAQTPPSNDAPLGLPAVSAPSGEPLVEEKAQLYIYDPRIFQFAPIGQAVSVMQILETGPFQYCLVVIDAGVPRISQPIDDRMNPHFAHAQASFTWVWIDEATGVPLHTFCLKFASEAELSTFQQAFGRAMYEASHKERFSKVKKDEQQYVVRAFQDADVEMADAGDEEEEWEEEEEEEEDEVEEDEKEAKGGLVGRLGPGDDSDEDDEEQEQADGSKNSQLAVGYKHNRSFVIRGNQIGVFKHTDDDQLKFATTINNVRTLNGQYFSPRKVMLHEQDSSMLLMNPNDEHGVYKMDLEYGKVVEEWKVDDNMSVDDLVPDSKYAQMTPQKTLIGINHNAIFRIDPRLRGNKRVDTETMQYQSKNNFSSAASTGKGELAVASSKGEIRLFNKVNMRAKTQLPGLGDPIIGIDVTEDGRWIIATCRNYLLLIDTEIKDEGKSGFQKSMGAKKPAPKRLQLKPEHLNWMKAPVNFTPAKFNTGEGEAEKTIVTSSGPFVITWNFRRVKAGRLYDYQIKKYDDNVVADNFKYGQDRAIVVALPENVEMVTKNKLQTPTKYLKSHSSIVNSPY